jgi:hypothetical protein
MWRIDIWVGRKWRRSGELKTFEEALEAVRGICGESTVVARGTLENPSPGQFCGILAYPFRGAHWWTDSGGKP